MRNIWTIARRELRMYFSSTIAYVAALIILLPLGFIFVLNLLSIMNSPYGYTTAPDARMVTGPMAFLLVFTTPAITMRLLAEEQRMGTMELLLTAPVRDSELVTGKWLGAFLFMLSVIAVSLIYVVLLNVMVDPGIDPMLMLSAYLGIILVTAAFLAVGVAASALFSNQIAAMFVTFGILVIFWWLIGSFGSFLPNASDFFAYLDMSGHFYNYLNNGILALTDVLYYVSVTALGLVVGTVAVEMRRWR